MSLYKKLLSVVVIFTIISGLCTACKKPAAIDDKSGEELQINSGNSDTNNTNDNNNTNSNTTGDTDNNSNTNTNTNNNSSNNTDNNNTNKQNVNQPGANNPSTGTGAFVYDESKLTLPRIDIDTLNKQPITSRDEFVSTTISVSNTTKEYSLTKVASQVRGRGNSTWSHFDKKPYRINFNMSQDLFGMGSARKWVLLSNPLDMTLMRTYIAFELARDFGVEYTTPSVWVNLYLNGNYEGVYLACQQVQEHNERVNIETDKTGVIDTGYLLEMEGSGNPGDYKSFSLDIIPGVTNWPSKNNYRVVIKSPGETACTDDQRIFIKDYVNKANAAILKKNWADIQKYVDVNSFVDSFIINQVFLNHDMGWCFYMYKRSGGKLYLGPVWDFDQSSGSSDHGGTTYEGWAAGTENAWFTALIKVPQFRVLVTKRYKEKQTLIEEGLFKKIDYVCEQYSFDIEMNFARWNVLGKSYWRAPAELKAFKTHEQHVDFLKEWLENRFAWIKKELNI